VTIRLTVEDCIVIFDSAICAGVLTDRARLEGAVAAPFSGFGDREFFPTLVEKAARLTFGIAEAQAYTDGNKRLAWLTTVAFLAENGTCLALTQEQAAELIWGIGLKTHCYEDLVEAYVVVIEDLPE
jgi:death-on-curing protein